MVHALSEIHRVLVPGGILIDLRPILDRWQVEVASARETRMTGRVQDFENGLDDDAAANRSVSEAEQKQWFVRENEDFFPYVYSWDTATEMEEWLEEEWNDFIALDEKAKKSTRSAWALGDGDSRVRLRMKMLVTRWRRGKKGEVIYSRKRKAP